jgi:hypothetical protein
MLRSLPNPANDFDTLELCLVPGTILVPVPQVLCVYFQYDNISVVASRASRNLDSAFSETRLETEHSLLSPEASRIR